MRPFSVAVVAVVVAAVACVPVDDVGEGEGEGEGEGDVDGDCFDDVFAGPADGAPVVVYADGFRVGASAACADGELYEVYFELAAPTAFTRVQASFDGAAAVDVASVDADFDGFRGDACGPAVTSSITVGVQVTNASGPSVPRCGTAF
jgi:hypothetical protein